jgi:hypothetical protein
MWDAAGVCSVLQMQRWDVQTPRHTAPPYLICMRARPQAASKPQANIADSMSLPAAQQLPQHQRRDEI